MNELLIGLAAVGALALGGLALYNRIEERRFKRQFDDEAMPDAADPLLDRPVGFASGEPAFSAPEAVAERREPHLSSEPADQGGGEESVSEPRVVVPGYDDAPPPAPRAELPRIAAPCDETLDFCVQIDGNGVHGGVFTDVVGRCRAFHRPVRWWGLPQDSKTWQELQPWRDACYEHVLVSVQLADRNGATSADDLSAVLALVEPLARRHNLSLVADDVAESARHAQTLDAFCVDVDLLIGVNVVAATEGGELAQAPLLDRARAAGLTLAADGSYQLSDARNEIVFQLVNHEAEAFVAGQATPGVTLQFDVPRVAAGLDAFDRMIQLGRELAEASGGRMVDDNMRPLTDSGIDKIRAQLAAIYQRMQANGVPAGSPRALRLFA